MRNIFAKTMFTVAAEDPLLTVMVGDISHGILKDMWTTYPERYANIGVCEPTMMSIAAGQAMAGLYPVVHTIAPFLIERSYEQIKLDFCYQQLGCSIVSVGSAFDYADLGCSHHCYNDYGILKVLPTMEVVYPASENEFIQLFRATYQNGRPTYFRLPGKKHGVSFADADIVFGKILRVREGKDLTIVALGPQLASAVAAAEMLEKQGISTDILYPHTIKPLDTEAILASAEKTKRVLVVEEHSIANGVGADVLALTHGMPGVRVDRLGIPEMFLRQYGEYQEHCNALGVTPEGVVSRATALLA